jgi:DNA-binding NarL/FixJ family response regulator
MRTVVIIGHYPTTCMGLSIVLKNRFKKIKTYTANSFQAFTEKMSKVIPDVIILNANVNQQPNINVLIEEMKQKFGDARVILYDENNEISQKVIYPGLGVHGYLLQKNELDELYNCIKTSIETSIQ